MNWLVVSCHGSFIANRDAARRGELHLDRRGFLNPQPSTLNPQPSTCRLRRGFSFAEILFAVMILGIGFIMVAAMFPVAIKQTELTSQETAAANMSVAGVSSFEQLATNAYFPVIFSVNRGFSSNGYNLAPPSTAVPSVIHSPVFTFHDPRLIPPDYTPGPNALSRDQVWQAVCNNLILPSDARYAWVPMYRRDWILNDGVNPIGATYANYHLSPLVQLTLIGVQIRNRSLYTQQDLTPIPIGAPNAEATLEGHVTTATIRQAPFGTAQPATITFLNQLPNGQTDDPSRIGEGAFVVISDDGISYDTLAPFPAGNFNGWILKVGVYRPDLTANNSPTYELVPGYDLPSGKNLGSGASPLQVIVVGRGRGVSSPFEGNVQDVSVYTTYIRVQG